MIAILSLFIPPLFLVFHRQKIFHNDITLIKKVIIYALSSLGLNWIMMMVLAYIFNNMDNLVLKLNTYNSFACKYILGAMALAWVEPYVEHSLIIFMKERLEFHIPKFIGPPSFKNFRLYASAYAALLFFLNFIRIFDNNFWGDEAITIYQMTGSFASITAWTARDVHPPLYYYILKIVYMIFGDRGWAYHLLSLVPCLIIIILSLTVFWKKFGGKTSVIMITFSALSYNAVYYNMEVRMYSWAGLFVLLSFYGLWKILEKQRTSDYIFFIIFSLAAAYTHYFAIITVAFFYISIMIIAVRFKRLKLNAVLITWISTIIAYLPWLIIFLKTIKRTAGSFWVTYTPSFKAAMEFLFSSIFSGAALWLILMCMIILYFLYETNILGININSGKKVCVSISFDQIRSSNIAILVAVGIFCVLGTILFAISYSKIVRPVFSYRYIYAASVIAWIVVAIVVPRLKFGKLWTIILWSFLLVEFIPGYQDIYQKEKQINETLQKTLNVTTEISTEDIIFVDQKYINWVVMHYYYPGINIQGIELDAFPELDEGTCYYLFLSEKQDGTAAFRKLNMQGFSYTQIIEEGNLGTQTVNVYRLEKEQIK